MTGSGLMGGIKRFMKTAKKTIRLKYYAGITLLHGLSQPLEKKVLFLNYSGKQYSDNPRAVAEKMHALYPDFQLVWYLQDKSKNRTPSIPSYIRIISGPITVYYKELATSFCLVSNHNFDYDTHKRKGQLFIDLWHADRPLKKILHDRYSDGKRTVPVTDDKVVDFCVSGSKFGTQMFKTAMRFNGEILQIGCPRNDQLLIPDKERGEAVRKFFGIDKGKKVFLYAPTFRDSNTIKQKAEVNLVETLRVLRESDPNWVCLFRSHPTHSQLDVVADGCDNPCKRVIPA